jgi:hypothetical protein
MPTAKLKAKARKAFAFTGANTIAVADDSQTVMQLTLTASKGRLNLGSTAGLTLVQGINTRQVVLQGSLASLNAALATLSFTASKAGKYTLTLLTEDLDSSSPGGPLSDTDLINLRVK